MVYYGMGFSYHTTYHTTEPYQVLQYADENQDPEFQSLLKLRRS